MTSLIPRPSERTIDSGSFPLPQQLRVVSDEPDAIAAFEIVASLAANTAAPPWCLADGAEVDQPEIRLVPATVDLGEGYVIQVAAAGIVIGASNRSGWLYGLMTLWQLLRGTDGEIENQSIADSPRFEWRGLHLDVCRHFFDVEFIKRLLDVMAIHKLNRFHWHLTEDQGWRIDIPNYPRLKKISAWRDEKDGTRYGGIYTHDEMREVVQYAAERCITVVPEIELPGHSVAALAAYPELACTPGPFSVETGWGIFDDVYCAGNDAVFEFLKESFRVTMDIFPGEYVHIGGDECPKTRWKACPKCQQRMKDNKLKDEEHLQSWFVGQMVSFLHENGKKAIGWDEILEGGLAPGATVMSWQGMSGGIEAAKQGHDVIMAPTTNCYFDYRQRDAEDEMGFHGVITLKDVYDLEPVPSELTVEQSQHILGAQANIWTERQLTNPAAVEYMVLPRLAALAEVVWSPQTDRDWDDFQTRIGPHVELLKELGYRPRPV